jgi:hypothetical protein
MNLKLATALVATAFASTVMAQSESNPVTLHGSVQSDIVVPENDSKIGTEPTSDDVLNNTYVDLNLTSEHVDAGAHLEYLEHPLQGFEPDFKGWGVPHLYVKAKASGFEVTIGDYYEQFGSGFILRTYEERSLGIDNSLRGMRIKLDAIKGLSIKALAGLQRRYWDWKSNAIYGADAEINIDEYSQHMRNNNTTWMIGGSWVLKSESKEDISVPGTNYALNMPKYVNAFDFRTRFQKQNFSILAEYAMKSEDPSFDNGYTFHKGNATMLSASYSKTGMSALIQAKRSEDMAFRSQRSMNGVSAFVNNMPAFAYQHTYALAALYPYATQYGKNDGTTLVPGEWAFQGEFSYNFKRKTTLGGKYGTKVKLNMSHIRGLDYTAENKFHGSTIGTNGYKSDFFGMSDDIYYQDINLQVEKKVSKDFKLNLMYMNQRYNQEIVEGHGGTIKSNIFVAEGKYQFNKKLTLRAEAQYLNTKHESDDWWYGMLELSALPNFMFTLSDMYGRPYVNGRYEDKEHYYMGSVTYNKGAHRIMAGYGRTRAGYNCSGGVCRWVPANKGVQVSYNYTF